MSHAKEKIMKAVFAAAACASILAVALICLFLFANGIPGMAKIGVLKFLFGTQWRPSNDLYGILPMILGSLYVTAGACLIGVPLGVLTAVFLVYYSPKPLARVVDPLVQLLAGVPSVVYGFFGVIVLVPLSRRLFGGSGSSILTASVLLGIMILPTVVSVCASSLRAVPSYYYEGGRALGATHERSIFLIDLKAAQSGVLSAVVLGLGRAVGETMAVIMVAGNQAREPNSLFAGVRTLTANIVLEMGYAADLHREALIATGVVLFVFILLINLCFSAIKGRDAK
ncbi:MAG: phosphate ABC transporter permease subunit PstC [Oscillospiraceae bacterium]|nr:phosphate ABC transporter permease subunit PstC [Oscillospiraceae bacterium]